MTVLTFRIFDERTRQNTTVAYGRPFDHVVKLDGVPTGKAQQIPALVSGPSSLPAGLIKFAVSPGYLGVWSYKVTDTINTFLGDINKDVAQEMSRLLQAASPQPPSITIGLERTENTDSLPELPGTRFRNGDGWFAQSMDWWGANHYWLAFGKVFCLVETFTEAEMRLFERLAPFPVAPKETPVTEKRCEGCQAEEAKLRCGACKMAYYCSKECQRAGWGLHKYQCMPSVRERARTESSEQSRKATSVFNEKYPS